MKDDLHCEHEDVKLRKMYDEGKLSSEDFLRKLFNSKNANRLRRAIVKESERLYNN